MVIMEQRNKVLDIMLLWKVILIALLLWQVYIAYSIRMMLDIDIGVSDHMCNDLTKFESY